MGGVIGRVPPQLYQHERVSLAAYIYIYIHQLYINGLPLVSSKSYSCTLICATTRECGVLQVYRLHRTGFGCCYDSLWIISPHLVRWSHGRAGRTERVSVAHKYWVHLLTSWMLLLRYGFIFVGSLYVGLQISKGSFQGTTSALMICTISASKYA